MDESPDPVEEALLAGVAGLDVGEIVLFTAAARDPGALVLTGDKRALETLASDARCRDLARTLEGRILCWEQMLELALRAAPFEAVRDRVAPRLDVDTATRAIFGSGAASTERSVRDAVAAYVADLRRRTGRLLRE